jgi:serine/threonine kinase 16
MGCSFSGLNTIYGAATGGGDVWINERRFRVIRQIGEGGLAFVYLVKEQQPASDAAPAKRHDAHVSGPPHHPRPPLRALDFASVCWISS